MTAIRAQVIGDTAAALPRDQVVNTLHFKHSIPVLPDGTGWDDLANDLLNLYKAKGGEYRGITSWTVKLYNLADPKPRYPKTIKTGAVTTPNTLASPREVAICLSFRGDKNVPRQRGRIFVGPAQCNTARPAAGDITKILSHADGFANLGGIDVDWCVYSRTEDGAGNGSAGMHPVQYAWVDDEWDIQRRRGQKATSRTGKAFSE